MPCSFKSSSSAPKATMTVCFRSPSSSLQPIAAIAKYYGGGFIPCVRGCLCCSLQIVACPKHYYETWKETCAQTCRHEAALLYCSILVWPYVMNTNFPPATIQGYGQHTENLVFQLCQKNKAQATLSFKTCFMSLRSCPWLHTASTFCLQQSDIQQHSAVMQDFSLRHLELCHHHKRLCNGRGRCKEGVPRPGLQKHLQGIRWPRQVHSNQWHYKLGIRRSDNHHMVHLCQSARSSERWSKRNKRTCRSQAKLHSWWTWKQLWFATCWLWFVKNEKGRHNMRSNHYGKYWILLAISIVWVHLGFTHPHGTSICVEFYSG